MQIRKLETELDYTQEVSNSQLLKLKTSLKGNGIDKKSIKILKKMGIKIYTSGKEHLILTNGIRKYFCAKTPSNNRNGRNIYTGIRQTFFPQSYSTN